MGGSIFTAGEGWNTFSPRREILEAFLKPVVVFPEPCLGFAPQNIVPEMGVSFFQAHGNNLSKLHRNFEGLSPSQRA
jgi:hypothetical protein